jgi:hypothetical protein
VINQFFSITTKVAFDHPASILRPQAGEVHPGLWRKPAARPDSRNLESMALRAKKARPVRIEGPSIVLDAVELMALQAALVMKGRLQLVAEFDRLG